MTHIKKNPYINKFYLSLTAALLIFSTACQPPRKKLRALTNSAQEELLCRQNFDNFNNALYNFWLEKEETPDTKSFTKSLEELIDQDENWSEVDNETKSAASTALSNYYEFVNDQLTSTGKNPDEKLALLTSLEIGDNSDEKSDLQAQWEIKKSELKAKLRNLNSPCEKISQPKPDSNPNDSIPNTPDESQQPNNPLPSLNPVVKGLRAAFTTAYQTCDSILLPPLDKNTPSLKGITILKDRHSDGVGLKRTYGDVNKIVKSHPYYKNTSPDQGCFDSRNKPLIYDYGGKPKVTTGQSMELDFFTNDGSGTSALGIDCSGFIFSAIGRSSLKLSPTKELKAVLVHGISAKMYKNAKKNGLTCFEDVLAAPPKIDETYLAPGDIIASTGHVVMVDEIGKDPLGLHRASTLADCNDTKLNSSGFDFIVTHSSPWKGGVGINRAQARAYLEDSSAMKKGLTAFAIAQCKKLFDPKSPSTWSHTDINIVRHNGTPECLSPKRIRFNHESCIASCNLDVSSERIISRINNASMK